jgi:hypothetical protein
MRRTPARIDGRPGQSLRACLRACVCVRSHPSFFRVHPHCAVESEGATTVVVAAAPAEAARASLAAAVLWTIATGTARRIVIETATVIETVIVIVTAIVTESEIGTVKAVIESETETATESERENEVACIIQR